MGFSTVDYIVFGTYLLGIMSFGVYLARKEGGSMTTKDYFLASGTLPWWAIGGSLIASNISTEQILGMNGSGFVMGLAISTYELMAALTLIVVAKFFLPVFLKEGLFTMPQFIERRYDNKVKTLLAVFWVALFVFVNITSIFYLGGLAIQSLLGVPLMWGIVGLMIYSATFSIFGGLKAVVWTDVVQVIILVIGGMMATYMVLHAVGGGFFSGLATLMNDLPEKFDMVLDKNHPSYADLPGISVLIGGIWIANLYYWGNNQYIIQRALAAKNIREAQKGVAFAAVLKLFMPLIVVVPGIAAYYLHADIDKPDQAFPWVLNNHVVFGLKGLVFAALVAAIGSSISSMVNSASTIFTLDIYKQLQKKDVGELHLVNVGKVTSAMALIIGAIIAPMLGSLDQVFQYIQEYTGFISPGVVVVFIWGIFWKRATPQAALWVILASIPLSMLLKLGYPDLPFLDRMGFSFVALSALLVAISQLTSSEASSPTRENYLLLIIVGFISVISLPAGIKIIVEDGKVATWFGVLIVALCLFCFVALFRERKADNEKAIIVEPGLFRTSQLFNIASVAVMLILAAIYATFW